MKGRFTEEENSAILAAMFQYQVVCSTWSMLFLIPGSDDLVQDNKLSEDDMDAIVMGGARRKHPNFWREISMFVLYIFTSRPHEP